MSYLGLLVPGKEIKLINIDGSKGNDEFDIP